MSNTRPVPAQPAARIVVPVDLTPSFDGRASLLVRPFAGHSSLLRATLSRLLATGLGPIVVAHTGRDHDRVLGALVEGLDVSLLACPDGGGAIDRARAALAREPAPVCVMVDPRAAFVSAAVIAAQLRAHAARRADVTLCSLAARGLAGAVVDPGALDVIAAAFAREAELELSSLEIDAIERMRGAFDVGEAPVDAAFVCPPVDLLPTTRGQLSALEPLVLRDDSQDYAPVFASLCERQWRRRSPSLRSARARAAGRPRIILAHYTNNRTVGSTRALELLLNGLRHVHRDRAVVVLPSDGELSEHLRELGWRVCVAPVSWMGPRDLTTSGTPWADEVQTCIEILDAEKPDLVYVSGALPAMSVAARLSGIPSVCHMHLPLMTFPPELGALIPRRVLLPWHDVVVATSDWFRDDLARTFRAPPGRIVSIPPGIDVSRFHPCAADRAQDRAKLGIPSDAEVILVAGTLGAIKRPELAIDVLERLASRRPRAMLMFAGAERNDPRYAQRLVERGAAVGLSDRIRLLGHREDMPAIYAACDLLLFCGIADNFGMVITEAMAMERPVVAVAIHGPGEIVRHEETGLLVPPPGDPDALANAVERGLDPQLAAVMGRNGRQRVVERYTIGRSAHDLDSVFDRLLEP